MFHLLAKVTVADAARLTLWRSAGRDLHGEERRWRLEFAFRKVTVEAPFTHGAMKYSIDAEGQIDRAGTRVQMTVSSDIGSWLCAAFGDRDVGWTVSV